MGARQSKRSVDITTTPKKEGENAVVEGEGKMEKIGDMDVKVTSNGAIHNNTDIEYAVSSFQNCPNGVTGIIISCTGKERVSSRYVFLH